MSEREDGFYWVSFGDEWDIAEYSQKLNKWFEIGCDTLWTDDDFEQIDERRIVRTEPGASV